MAMRFDAMIGSRVERLDSGALRIEGRLARAGIQTYTRADGRKVRELRAPEEVFRADSLAGFRSAPVTLQHPATGRVDSDTWAGLAKGHVEDVRQDGDYVAGSVIVSEPGAVAAIESGVRQLSGGYHCDVDETPGVWRGQQYDARQTNIKINHVALVRSGRAGPDVALRLDADDATADEQETETMKMIRIDGRDVEYGGADHMTHLDSLIATGTKTAAENKAEADKQQARADAAEEELTKLKATAEADKAEARKRLDAAADERADLIDAARSACGKEFSPSGKSAREIRVAVVKATRTDFDDTGKSDDYVLAAYDFARTKGTSRLDGATEIRIDAADKASVTSIDEARKKQRETYANAWKTAEEK